MEDPMPTGTGNGPLGRLEEWEDFVAARYAGDQAGAGEPASGFRDYEGDDVRPSVREFYRQNHSNQTLAFVIEKKRDFLGLRRRRMGIWEAIEYLNELVDDSDPDTELSQLEHLLQTSEAIRRDGHPDWFVLTGLIHDLGKILCLFGEPQWAVVGDTYPVGCAFDERVVFHGFFASNPDASDPLYATPCGIYDEGCGLDRVHMSWGHDEYLYHVVKEHLPLPALYMIRYHSFYAAHREGAYRHLMNDQDLENLPWLRAFSRYDLYSKGSEPPDADGLRGHYTDLIDRYFPTALDW